MLASLKLSVQCVWKRYIVFWHLLWMRNGWLSSLAPFSFWATESVLSAKSCFFYASVLSFTLPHTDEARGSGTAGTCLELRYQDNLSWQSNRNWNSSTFYFLLQPKKKKTKQNSFVSRGLTSSGKSLAQRCGCQTVGMFAAVLSSSSHKTGFSGMMPRHSFFPVLAVISHSIFQYSTLVKDMWKVQLGNTRHDSHICSV